jgi:hypothetical protein
MRLRYAIILVGVYGLVSPASAALNVHCSVFVLGAGVHSMLTKPIFSRYGVNVLEPKDLVDGVPADSGWILLKPWLWMAQAPLRLRSGSAQALLRLCSGRSGRCSESAKQKSRV